MVADLEVGQVGERCGVRGDDRPARRRCGCGDQQVVRSARRSLAAHFDEQSRVSLGDRYVVGDHGERCEYVLDESGPRCSGLSRSEQRTNSELGDGDRRDGDVVLIGDHLVEGVAGSVGVDEERRVEQEPPQDRSSISTNRRMEDSSSDQFASRRCRRSKAFASAPSPGRAGSRCAMGFPRRTTVKCSPRCSTASRMSAKFRAASVALTSGTRSDYQMCRRMSPMSPSRGLQGLRSDLCPQIKSVDLGLRSRTRSRPGTARVGVVASSSTVPTRATRLTSLTAPSGYADRRIPSAIWWSCCLACYSLPTTCATTSDIWS